MPQTPSPNDDRSQKKNPEHPQHQADVDNRRKLGHLPDPAPNKQPPAPAVTDPSKART